MFVHRFLQLQTAAVSGSRLPPAIIAYLQITSGQMAAYIMYFTAHFAGVTNMSSHYDLSHCDDMRSSAVWAKNTTSMYDNKQRD